MNFDHFQKARKLAPHKLSERNIVSRLPRQEKFLWKIFTVNENNQKHKNHHHHHLKRIQHQQQDLIWWNKVKVDWKPYVTADPYSCDVRNLKCCKRIHDREAGQSFYYITTLVYTLFCRLRKS